MNGLGHDAIIWGIALGAVVGTLGFGVIAVIVVADLVDWVRTMVQRRER